MGNKKLLVLIDDDADDHEIFEMALEEIGQTFQTLHFGDCEQALSHFSIPGAEQPGFVFIDINLPRISGVECIDKLHTLHSFDHPKIVIYSSSFPRRWREKLDQIGMVDFLQKTGSLSILKQNLTALILPM